MGDISSIKKNLALPVGLFVCVNAMNDSPLDPLNLFGWTLIGVKTSWNTKLLFTYSVGNTSPAV